MGTAHPAKILLNVHSFSALYGFLLFNVNVMIEPEHILWCLCVSKFAQ